MSYARINKVVNPDQNFWELNPFFKVIDPFSNLYEQDKSKNKIESSKKMIAVFLLTEVDEEENPFARMALDFRREMINKKITDTSDLDPYIDAYLLHHRTLAERTLYEELETLTTRGKLIRDTPITLDTSTEEIDPLTGKKYVLTIKGTASQLEQMRKNTGPIYKAYDDAKKLFEKEKLDSKTFGQSKLTNSDKAKI